MQDERRKFEVAALKVRAARTTWLQQHGVPISPEFANFADAVGELVELAEARAEQAETPRAAESDYKTLVELAARVLLQHMNDEDYEMSIAGLYATLTEHKSTPAPTEPLQIHSGLKVRCHDCGGYQIWRCTEKDVIEVFHDCVAGRAKKAAPVKDRPAAETPPEDLVVTIARELYDRFVMGGWEPQDAYGQIREWLRQAEWISVATRLPERLGAFIIWHRSGYVDTWHFNPIDKFNVNHWKRNATHWQELPACPVEAAPVEDRPDKIWNAGWSWLTGGTCPFCGAWYSGYWHRMCPELAKLSTADAARLITSKVRDILKDDPADKFVHVAHEACDKMDEAFKEEKDKL